MATSKSVKPSGDSLDQVLIADEFGTGVDGGFGGGALGEDGDADVLAGAVRQGRRNPGPFDRSSGDPRRGGRKG